MVRKAHMNVEHTKSTSRRALLAASGTATIAAFAGCVGGDDDSDDTAAENGNEDGGTDTATNGDDTEQPVFVLVEGVGGGGHDHGGESGDKHEGEGEHSYMQEGLTSSELDHACGHMEEIDEFGASSVEGATSADAPSYLEEVHVPYEVEFEGDSAYVAFKMGGDSNDHGSGQMLAFFTRGGSSSVVEGELVYDEGDESQCAPMDRYVVVQPTNGEAVVELTPE